MTNNLASSGLWNMLYIPIFILTTDGTIGCTMNNNWDQMVCHQIFDLGPHTYPVLQCIDIKCEVPMPPCTPCGVGHVQWASGVMEESKLEVLGC